MTAPSLRNALAIAAMRSLIERSSLSYAEAASKAYEIADLVMRSERVKA